MTQPPFCQHGGLTIVPMPGFELMALEIKRKIEERGSQPRKQATPVDIATPSFDLHINGEPNPRLDKQHVGDHDCVVLASGPGTYEMMMKLLLVIALLSGRRASRICVMFGYCPLSRSDKDEGDKVLAWPAWFFGQIACAAHGKLDRIIVVDPHSQQLVMAGHPGLITPVTMMRRVFKQAITEALQTGKQICVFFPDDGAAKGYEDAVDAVLKNFPDLTIGRVFGTKRRKSSAESAPLGLYGDTNLLPNSLVICVDDEAATLGTQMRTAEKVKRDYGVNEFWAGVSHGILCGNALHDFALPGAPIDRLIITDSIPQTDRVRAIKAVSVVSMASDVASMVYYHHWGIDIRAQR